MKLSDLTEAPIDPNNPIDRELAKTSNDIEKDGSLDQNDIDAQGDPSMAPLGDPQNAPDAPMAGAGAIEEPEPVKPVDPALLGKVQNHDYVSRYDHNEGDPSHPNTIMAMDMSELSTIRNEMRVKLDRIGIEDKVGSYANPENKAAQDILSFIDTIMGYKKAAVKQSPRQKSSKAKFNKQKPANTTAGKTFKPKKIK
jgi:hypothetical protein